MALLPISLSSVSLEFVHYKQSICLGWVHSSFCPFVWDTVPSTSSLTVKPFRPSLLATPSLMTNSVDLICLALDYPYQLILWIVLHILFWFLLLSEPTDEPTFMLCFSSLLDVWLLGTLSTYNATMENPSYDEECSFYLTWIFRSLFKITAKRTTGTILPIAQALTQGTRELKQDIYMYIASIPPFNQWFEEFCAFDSRCFW